MRSLLLAALLGIASACLADGPGTRIRATPAPPQPAGGPAEKDQQRCEAMSGEQKERCLRALRSTERGVERPPHAGPGPESTGPGASSAPGGVR